jgi:hypothetical protein
MSIPEHDPEEDSCRSARKFFSDDFSMTAAMPIPVKLYCGPYNPYGIVGTTDALILQ